MRLIDADALIDIFEDRLEKIRNRYGDYSGEAGVCAGALHLIRVQPTIEPERKKGEWLTSDDMYETGICSYCRYDTQEPVSYVITNFEYCPNCGARMEETE